LSDETKVPRSHEALVGAAMVFVSLAILAWLSNHNGLYFDDEIFTIQLLEGKPSLRSVIVAANSYDLHPPLSYAIQHLFHRLTGDWKSVQLVAGLVNAAAFAWFAFLAHRGLPRGAWLVLTGLLATFATGIMWGASLRWYAWFNPCFILALGLVLWGRMKPLASLAVLAGLGAVMFHINYLAVVAMPLLGLVWLWRYRSEIGWGTAKGALPILAAAALVCVPQLLVLLRVHLAYPLETQVGSVPMSLVQTGLTIALGNAVFPLNPLPLAVLAIYGASLLWSLRCLRLDSPLIALWALVLIGSAAMALSGLSMKPRNSVYLTIALLPLIASALASLPLKLRVPALLAAAAFMLQGMANVALHQGTDKRSFNTPHRQIVATIAQMAGSCRNAAVVNFDEVTAQALPANLFQTDRIRGIDRSFQPGDCLILARGSASECAQIVTGDLETILRRPTFRLETTRRFGPEPERARAARLLGRSIETHAAVVSLHRVTQATRIVLPYPAFNEQGFPACAPAQPSL
jgi:CheY-specific phosphatase CheX